MFEQIMEIGLLCVGLVLLVVGYRRNHRNLMLVAALALLAVGTFMPFTQGVIDGYQNAETRKL